MSKKRTGNSNRDIEELEKSYRSLAGTPKNKTGKYASKGGFSTKTALPVLICFVLVCVVVIGIIIAQNVRGNQSISANITIVGVDVTGMTREQAENAIEQAFETTHKGKDMVVTVDGQTITIPYSQSAVSVDAEKAVDLALRYSRFHTEKKSLDISSCIVINKEYIMNMLQDLQQQLSAQLTQTSYQIVGTMPTDLSKIDENTSVMLQITKGQAGIRLDVDLLYTEILCAYGEGKLETNYSSTVIEPDAQDWVSLSQQTGIAPVEAEMNPETFEITGGTYGFLFDAAQAEEAVSNAAYGETVQVAFQWVKPQNTAEELGAVLFRDVLATYTTKAGSDYSRNINLRIAAEACNGIILYPGDVFSFNKTLGERTPDKGYQLGASYVAGETVYDYGGGICQVASTIYYCTIVSDLKIVERYPHGYASAYTPLSTDATVFWPDVDFKFQNNTDYPIRIEASATKGNVTVSLVGTDTKDYYVKFEYKHLDTFAYETVYQEMPADNEQGFKDGDVITTPYTGYKSQGFRAKYDKVTGKLIERILESTDTYQSRDKVICKIITEETPTDPTEPTEPTNPTDPTTPTEPPASSEPTEAPTTPATDPVVTDPPVTTQPATEPPTTQTTTNPPSTEAPPPEEESQ